MLRVVSFLLAITMSIGLLPSATHAQEATCPGLMMAYNQPGPVRIMPDLFEIAKARCKGALMALHVGDQVEWRLTNEESKTPFTLTSVYTDSFQFDGSQMGFLNYRPVTVQSGDANRAFFYPIETNLKMQTVAVFMPNSSQNGVGYGYSALGLDRVVNMTRTRIIKLAEGGTGNRLQFMKPGQCISTKLSNGTTGSVQLDRIISSGFGMFDSGNSARIGHPVIASNAQYHSEIVGYVIAMRFSRDMYSDQNGIVVVMTTEGETGGC